MLQTARILSAGQQT